jgi:hypothetical protein
MISVVFYLVAFGFLGAESNYSYVTKEDKDDLMVLL